MNWLFNYLPVLKQLADIWTVLTLGTVAGVLCLVAAYYVAPLRQFLFGCAVACFLSTVMFGWGVKQERDVCKAREELAEKLRKERDELQKRIAADDEARRQAGLDDLNRKDNEDDEAYAKRLAARKSAPCTLTGDDL